MKLSLNILLACSTLSLQVLAQATSSCPGVFAVTSGAASGCCVGAATTTSNGNLFDERAIRTRRPTIIDSDPTTAVAAITTRTKTKTKTSKTSSSTMGPLTCATWIPVTQSNYNGLLQEASMSLMSTGTNLRTTITPTATGAAATSSSAGEAGRTPAMVGVGAIVVGALGWLV